MEFNVLHQGRRIQIIVEGILVTATPVVYQAGDDIGIGLLSAEGLVHPYAVKAPWDLIALWRATVALELCKKVTAETYRLVTVALKRHPSKRRVLARNALRGVISRSQIAKIVALRVPEELLKRIFERYAYGDQVSMNAITYEVGCQRLHWESSFRDYDVAHPDDDDSIMCSQNRRVKHQMKILQAYIQHAGLETDTILRNKLCIELQRNALDINLHKVVPNIQFGIAVARATIEARRIKKIHFSDYIGTSIKESLKAISQWLTQYHRINQQRYRNAEQDQLAKYYLEEITRVIEA